MLCIESHRFSSAFTCQSLRLISSRKATQFVPTLSKPAFHVTTHVPLALMRCISRLYVKEFITNTGQVKRTAIQDPLLTTGKAF